MSDDNSRDHEGPDRSDVSTPSTPDAELTDGTVRERLEAIDRLTRSLLGDIQAGTETTPTMDTDARSEACRHVREIRAEASHVGLLLFGPEMAIPYDPAAHDGDAPRVSRSSSLTTAFRGPVPGALEQNRQRDSDG
ncbi:hypothetical protein C488_04287 [Natrinema pellirubrum DSM 15624]|uniref:Uncharacterized protein n=1 Tax=Natrinema pellirubrum (strain DSM 15624 / CIP 106293 / JCM 10476 / NCIMB 786 / 157) TaxID=797303 RepID=L0JIP4_NATP1|nr:hypothetical protein [Natrinema pellirubrum]AGB30432.1 hypothetical protein Natpe_0502 [Natrinema pellirubrum DSM 15624]ELY79341.1 hypothetical protein C488_04287 [Natrinema pellirubrum DSM 15624]